MTLDGARECSKTRFQFSGGHNRGAVRLILGQAAREHGQGAVDAHIRALDLERVFGLGPGTDFSRAGRQRPCWPRVQAAGRLRVDAALQSAPEFLDP